LLQALYVVIKATVIQLRSTKTGLGRKETFLVIVTPKFPRWLN